MTAAIFFRTLGFLLILFVVVYIGTENTQQVNFHFSLLLEKPLSTNAALVYFALFAIGVIGGTLLNAGRASKSDSEGSGKAKKR
ncbi:MAG: hypothetical protein RL376_204 [Verrucomicrobiota bacterium]